MLTNNPDKARTLQEAEISCARVPMFSTCSRDNEAYLQAKATRMGHMGLLRRTEIEPQPDRQSLHESRE